MDARTDTAQTKKNLDLMMSVFADHATFTVARKTFAGKAKIKEFSAQAAERGCGLYASQPLQTHPRWHYGRERPSRVA
jgi:hypothetical protein